MLTKRILYLCGLGTAMVTPFTDDETKSVDYDRLRTLIRRQIGFCKPSEISAVVVTMLISASVAEWEQISANRNERDIHTYCDQ